MEKCKVCGMLHKLSKRQRDILISAHCVLDQVPLGVPGSEAARAIARVLELDGKCQAAWRE